MNTIMSIRNQNRISLGWNLDEEANNPAILPGNGRAQGERAVCKPAADKDATR